MTTIKKKYQVFISSTFKDLHEERQELTLALLDQHIPSGMEAFPAAPERGWKTIQAAIDDSDYYVLILAGLYGSVDDETGMSWTQREYEYAQEQGIPTLAFVRQDDSIPDTYREKDPKNAGLLDSFRERVRASFLCKPWSTSDSLIRHVKDGLSGATRSPDFGNQPGWYRGQPPDPLTVPKVVEPRAWQLRDALRVELISDDSNAVILRNRETSVKYWMRLTNLAPFYITPERIGLKWHITMNDRVQEGTKDVIEPFDTLGPAKEQRVQVDLSLDPWVGDAAPLARLAAGGSIVAAAPELGGRANDGIASFVYGRVADNRDPDLGGGMSPDALEYMTRLALAYKNSGYRNHKVWGFDAGSEEHFQEELRNLHGYIKLRGTRGAPYVLTDAGFRWVKRYLVSNPGE